MMSLLSFSSCWMVAISDWVTDPVLLAGTSQRPSRAQVDRQLDPALPVGPGVVDLLDEHQAGAKQGQADRDDHDQGDRHGQVPAKADPYLGEHELGTHVAESS
jgi:hypothetical protein